MDRIKEGRRVSLAATNGLTRRRHRTSSLRDSPEEDGVVDLHESTSFVDRSIVKKDRDRDRERDRDRYRDRDKERERDQFSRNKKRRTERLMHGNNRENGDDESSDESVNVDENEEGNGGTAGERVGSSMRLLPPNPSSLSSSAMANHHLHRKSFPPPSKVYKAPTTSTWRPTDEMIGVSVPRKARSASIKRSHDWLSSATGVVGEQLHRQESESPARSNGPSIPSMLSSPAPVSPSSSNASLKKKMMLNGSKPRPPKSNAKSPSSAQDEIEIEIAEVLYGMMRQPQVPSKQEIPGNDSVKSDIKDVSNNKSSADAKSRASSPISNSQSAAPHPPSILHANSSSASNHMLTIAPKRKRPRPIKYDDDNSSGFAAKKTPNSTSTNFELDHSDHPPTAETSLHTLRRELGSVTENGGISFNLIAEGAALCNKAELQSEAIVMSNATQITDSKPLIDKLEIREMGDAKDETVSSNKASPSGLGLDNDSGNFKAAKRNSTLPQIDSQREEKIQIDLMAPPLRPCSERNGEIDFVAVNSKSIVTGVEKEERRGSINEYVKTLESRKDVVSGEAVENNRTKAVAEAADLNKRVISKERNINLQLALEKCDRDSASIPPNESLQNGQKSQKQQQLPSHTDKNAQANSLPLQMSMASWPGGLPPMGYMPPLQGVVSMDGNTVSPVAMQPQHLPFGHPRPKRCATHCHIARNIHYHQQFSRMNPFWPAAAGSALPYGAKPCNVGVVPPTELLGNLSGRGAAQDKVQGLAMFPSHNGKDKGLQASNMADGAQRKQILIQQALPPGTPNNILHGPAFIFPISQQQAAAAASVRPGFLKSSPAVPSQGALSSTFSSTTTAAAAAGPAMSFSYPTIPGNEAQYLAILQNGAYPIPIPAHVAAPPAYRGSPHAQPMPFFNGSFYSSQMLHQSSQLPQQKLPATTTQSQQGQQNPTVSSGSSSSQKHFQNQLQMQPGIGLNGGLQSFSGQKNQVSSSLQLQPRLHPHPHTHNVSSQTRQVESDVASEDNPSTPDSRVSRANMNIYGQNFSLPFTPPNFALMTPGSASNSTSANEKKQPQQQGSKGESLPSQAFAMAFSSMNGGDISSLSQNYHVSAAPQHKKNYQSAEEVKSVRNDGSNPDEEIKAVSSVKVPTTYGQSIPFFRSDASGNNNSVSTIPGPTVIDSSSRTLNLGPGSTRGSNSIPSTSVATVDPSTTHHQLQLQRYQNQQLIMVHKQQAQAAAVAARTKGPDHVSPSSSIAAKFPNTISAFPQNLQSSSNNPGQGQSPQWKNSVRSVTSPTSASSTSSSLKSLPQQQMRPQQSHTQISFATNPKPSSTGGQASHQQSPSPPMMVGSPTTSHSRSAGGSPRTTASTTTGNKTGQASSLSSSQPAKSSQSVPNHKSSPVHTRNVGNTHMSPLNTGSKSQMPKQQLQKQAVQQSQMMFSNAYMQQVQQHHPAGTNANISTVASGGGYYLQRHQQQPPQQGSFTNSSGMLSLSNCDPTKVISAGNMKGVNQASFAAANTKGMPHQLVPSGFSYVQQHSAAATGQVKPNEQKQQQQGGE